MSRIYLVDTENVASTWQTILPELAADDLLLVFYTKNSPGIAYTDLGTLMQYIGRFSCVECYAGCNGLDFQLVSYLGYLLADHPDAEFVIVSRDTGYDAVCKFWTDKGKSVVRRTHVVAGEPTGEEAPAPEKSDDDLRERIGRLLAGVASPEEIGRVADLFAAGDVDQGQMHNALVLSFGAVRGLELYNMLRPVFRTAPARGTSQRAARTVRRRVTVKEAPKKEPKPELKPAAKPELKPAPKPEPQLAPKPEPQPAPVAPEVKPASPEAKPAKKRSGGRRRKASPAAEQPAAQDTKQPASPTAEQPAAQVVKPQPDAIQPAAEPEPAPAKKHRRAPRRKAKETAEKPE